MGRGQRGYIQNLREIRQAVWSLDKMTILFEQQQEQEEQEEEEEQQQLYVL